MSETGDVPPASVATDEVVDYKDKYLRLLADVENSRRRMQKEKQETVRFGIDNVLTEILAPMDQLEHALACADQMTGELKHWAMGFQMILGQFKEVLASHGVKPFDSKGEMFDSSKHEAIEMEETDQVPSGTIVQELRKGYRSGDRTIRAARVKVAQQVQNKEINDVKPSEEK